MTDSSAAKRQIAKLQKAIVDGLENVKAQDLRVFDTEHITSLFERVIVASGTSNRQTKALAASVRDAVREAGFDKPRIEGEDNGEWIIVDCGAAVVHIMQPSIRQYYQLEELWGDKPVRLKPATAAKTGAGARSDSARVAAGAAVPAKKTPAKKAAAKTAEAQAKRPAGARSVPEKDRVAAEAPALKTPAARKAATAAARAKPPAKRIAAAGAAPKSKGSQAAVGQTATAKKVAAQPKSTKPARAKRSP